ncbi:acylneuraminate cytidylyltransferase, partial [Nitrosopumilus sp.]|nr:acylneuraminate cytidylyltransferase [Nitrosopumilus sp.]
FLGEKYDYGTNELKRSFPQGIFGQVYSIETLEKTWNDAQLPSEREHVSPYIEKNQNIFKILNLEFGKNISNLRFTIDRESDLIFIKEIVKKIKKIPVNLEELTRICKEEPHLIQINKEHVIDEGYKKSIMDDKEFLNSN